MHSQLTDTHVSATDVGTALAGMTTRQRRPLAGISPQGVPKVLAAMLEHWPGTATSLLEYLAGRRLRFEQTYPEPGGSPVTRRLTSREDFRLRAAALTICTWRYGVLRTDDDDAMPAAAVSLAWLPARLPWDACHELDAGQEPAGRVLSRLPGGIRRVDRMALPAYTLEEITGREASVTSTAVLEADGFGRVAIAEEFILREFAESLAG